MYQGITAAAKFSWQSVTSQLESVSFQSNPETVMPRVSVIIPSYNNAHYLVEAIDSVLKQSYCNYEIIVIDDGSTDNTREIAASYGDKIRYIWQENRGLGGARNTGIRAAQGELVGLLDADDQWKPDYLERMVAFTASQPGAAVYYCAAQAMDSNGDELPQLFGGDVIPPDQMYDQLLRVGFIIPSTVLMRRSVILDAGLFEETRRSIHGCEDWDLWLRISRGNLIVGTSQCLARYRLHNSSLSANPRGMQEAARTVMDKNFGPDDGNWNTWSKDKRRAYGGVYRFHLLTAIQYQNDWQSSVQTLKRALLIDPSLAFDRNLFYELALGNQPRGYRDTSNHLDIERNAANIQELLRSTFADDKNAVLKQVRRRTYGTAYLALGLVAYNNGDRSLSRRFLSRALIFRPGLWSERRVVGCLIKSFIDRSKLESIKKLRTQILHPR